MNRSISSSCCFTCAASSSEMEANRDCDDEWHKTFIICLLVSCLTCAASSSPPAVVAAARRMLGGGQLTRARAPLGTGTTRPRRTGVTAACGGAAGDPPATSRGGIPVMAALFEGVGHAATDDEVSRACVSIRSMDKAPPGAMQESDRGGAAGDPGECVAGAEESFEEPLMTWIPAGRIRWHSRK
ncbi:hypothetical protein PVAP13_5NG525786 [Panicum virgatum]|uniref:Uncharacterized protein n=1 Tax=Panicum virgatum TaxID=38727 RepID=A0A8T0S5U8_PANVG|nr:hypothetical protein PVAP13_5NG525786 [Panicum virgatum]